MIGLYAGLRKGEVIALTWEDIDFKSRLIHVNKSVRMVNNSYPELKDPKTKAGIRSVYIPDRLYNYLLIHRDKGFILKSQSGKIMTYHAWRRMWDSYILELNRAHQGITVSKFSKAGIPIAPFVFTFHNLRHTYSSLLYAAEIDPLTMAGQIGHSEADISINRYSHIDIEFQTKAMQKYNDFLNDVNSDVK